LRYATAQSMTLLKHAQRDVYVFCETEGIAAEFAFEATTLASSADDIVRPALRQPVRIDCADGTCIDLLLLSHEDAKRVTALSIDGQRRLILTDALAFERDGKLVLRSMGAESFEFAVYPPPEAMHALTELPTEDAFGRFIVSVPETHVDVEVTKIRPAQTVPQVRIGGAARAAIEPTPETFGKAAAWRIDLPPHAFTTHGLANAYLKIDYTGDIGRLFSGTNLIDDHFYNGLPWRVGMRNVAIDPHAPLVLTVLPLRADAPIYLDARPSIEDQIAEVRHVEWIPEYEVIVTLTFE
jgi:beta-galactosidase